MLLDLRIGKGSISTVISTTLWFTKTDVVLVSFTNLYYYYLLLNAQIHHIDTRNFANYYFLAGRLSRWRWKFCVRLNLFVNSICVLYSIFSGEWISAIPGEWNAIVRAIFQSASHDRSKLRQPNSTCRIIVANQPGCKFHVRQTGRVRRL